MLPKTKKELREKCHYSKYGRGQDVAHGIFFDWACEPGQGIGFKYCFLAWDCTKAEAFQAFWNIYVYGNRPEHVNVRCEAYTAETMEQRRKVPLSANCWGNFSK